MMMYITIKTKILFLTIFLAIENGECTGPQYKWMYHKPYGSTVNLEPLFNETLCTNQSQCYWLLPDKSTRLYYPISGSSIGKYSMRSDGILTIVDIQSNDNGIYHFFKLNGSNWMVSKALLNLRGAPYDSLWLEYWPNVVGGLVAMAAVFITFALIMLANKYRYRSPLTFSTRPLSKRPGTVVPFNESVIIERSNPVFVNDDNLTVSTQKRSRRSSSNSNITDLRVERL